MDPDVANADNTLSQPPSQSIIHNPYVASSSLGPLPIGDMNAPNTALGYSTAIKYSNDFFEGRGVEDRFSTLKEEDVECDHLRFIFDNLIHWLATMSFKVNTASGYMVPSGKETKYKQMKSVFQKNPESPTVQGRVLLVNNGNSIQ